MISRNVISKWERMRAIIKTNDNRQAIATTTDCNIFYCDVDPYQGVIQAISESYRNLISVGAKPLAITNCLNFGNPERKEIMGQFVQTIKGMKIASQKLSLPIILEMFHFTMKQIKKHTTYSSNRRSRNHKRLQKNNLTLIF